MLRSSGAKCASAASSARPGSSASSWPAGATRRGARGRDHARMYPHRVARPFRRNRCPAGARPGRLPGSSAARTRTSRRAKPRSSTTSRSTGRRRRRRAGSRGSSTDLSARATRRRWNRGWRKSRRVDCASSVRSSPGCSGIAPPSGPPSRRNGVRGKSRPGQQAEAGEARCSGAPTPTYCVGGSSALPEPIVIATSAGDRRVRRPQRQRARGT